MHTCVLRVRFIYFSFSLSLSVAFFLFSFSFSTSNLTWTSHIGYFSPVFFFRTLFQFNNTDQFQQIRRSIVKKFNNYILIMKTSITWLSLFYFLNFTDETREREREKSKGFSLTFFLNCVLSRRQQFWSGIFSSDHVYFLHRSVLLLID